MDIRLDIFHDLLRAFRPGSLLDLGCGHGKFSLIAHGAGWRVTAVDARRDRMPMTPGINWVQSDVRTFQFGEYDCIALLGLLYHLDLPAQLDLLKRCAGTPLILDTHVALTATKAEGGYEGRLFEEAPGDDLETVPTASWENRWSFWPTEESLLHMLRDSGFRRVLKSHPPYLADRTFYLCI